MKKILLAAVLTLVPAVFSTGNAQAQTKATGYGTEVCVNQSLAAEAKQRFPYARIHVVPDSTDLSMNGWRIVSGAVNAKGRIMTDAEELQARQRDQEFNDRFYHD